MSELFETEESLSPELQWLNEAVDSTRAILSFDSESPESVKWSARVGFRSFYAATKHDCLDMLCDSIGIFPTFDQWKLERAKQ